MTPELGAGLAFLALVDSTSIGTLVIPVWLMLSPGRVHQARLAVYLAAVAGFYFLVGVGLLLLARVGADALQAPPSSRTLLWAQLVLGLGLFAVSWRYDSRRRRKRSEPDRSLRWRDRALTGDTSVRGLVALGWTAGLLELITMVPYLAAIGLLAAADVPAAVGILLLALYGLVMVLPAALLIGLRTMLGRRLDAGLRRIDAVLSRHADSAIGWVMGLVADAVARLVAPAAYGA